MARASSLRYVGIHEKDLEGLVLMEGGHVRNMTPIETSLLVDQCSYFLRNAKRKGAPDFKFHESQTISKSAFKLSAMGY